LFALEKGHEHSLKNFIPLERKTREKKNEFNIHEQSKLDDGAGLIM